MKKSILFFLLALPFMAFAQDFMPTVVTMKDKTTKTGIVGFPLIVTSNKIKFKTNDEAETIKIASDEIDKMEVKVADKTFTFIYTDYQYYIGKTESNTSADKCWIALVDFCDPFYLYQSASQYDFVKEGLEFTSVSNIQYAGSYLIKHKTARRPTVIDEAISGGVLPGIKNAFRYRARRYFKDYPKLLQRINDKEFGRIWDLFPVICKTGLE